MRVRVPFPEVSPVLERALYLIVLLLLRVLGLA
jgi:hypothetical protein